MNNDGQWVGRGYDAWSREFNKMMDISLAESDPSGDAFKKQAAKTYTSKNRLNNLTSYLKLCGMCPAICFVFSRKKVEEIANDITFPLFEEGEKDYEIGNVCKQMIVSKVTNWKEYIMLPEYAHYMKLLNKT
jgi:superfamily II RNA helicase